MHLINHEVILASPTIYDACESRTRYYMYVMQSVEEC